MSLAIREARRSHHEDDKPHPYLGGGCERNGVLATACRGDQAPGDMPSSVPRKEVGLTKLAGCTVYTTLSHAPLGITEDSCANR